MKDKNKVKVYVLLFVIMFAAAILIGELNASITALAEEPEYYTVYTESGDELCVREEEVSVGDGYISYNNKRYEIVEVDEKTKKCKAKFVEDVKIPNMNIDNNLVSTLVEIDKSAALYITHNDESYIPSDGTESIYGAGGIHDVARAFADALRNEGFIVTLDETLHLPHDVSAYNRSRTTANKLLKENNPDVLFDIHRDGAPRRLYDTVVGGEPMSKVRIVVGQDNPNFDANYQFALEIKALADEWYPGLIADIYLGGRGYNQDLLNQALLLEFGSEQIEKELALKSVVPFANVINGVLQKRAVQGAGTGGYNTNLFLQIQNGTGVNSTIFNLMLFLGSFLIIAFIIFLSNSRFREKVIASFKEVKKGIYITRKKG